jgi:hypothetical protein
MKGSKQIELNGKKIDLRFTLGVLEDFQEYCENLKISSDEALQSMKHMREFLHLMTKYAGKEVKSDEFKFLDFDQMQEAVGLIESATGQLGNPKAGAKK